MNPIVGKVYLTRELSSDECFPSMSNNGLSSETVPPGKICFCVEFMSPIGYCLLPFIGSLAKSLRRMDTFRQR
jgi:hypothetical protein